MEQKQPTLEQADAEIARLKVQHSDATRQCKHLLEMVIPGVEKTINDTEQGLNQLEQYRGQLLAAAQAAQQALENAAKADKAAQAPKNGDGRTVEEVVSTVAKEAASSISKKPVNRMAEDPK